MNLKNSVFIPLLFYVSTLVAEQQFSKSVLYVNLNDNDKKLQKQIQNKVKKTPSTMYESELAILLNQNELLKNNNMELEGRIEVLEEKIRQIEEDFRERYIDLDQRINNAKQNVLKDNIELSESHENEKNQYKKAYQLISKKKFDEALSAFELFIKKFPDSILVDSAYYWRGEIFLMKKDLQRAKLHFQIVVDLYPNSSKIPDSLYKLAKISYELGDVLDAKERINFILKKYEHTSAAQIAKELLKKID